MKKVAIALVVIIAAVGVAYGVYRFQGTRLTAERLQAIRDAERRLAEAEAQARAEAEAAKAEAEAAKTVLIAAKDGAAADKPAGPTQEESDMAGEEAGEQPTYKVRFDCSCGSFVVAVYADWAPRGAQRFRELVEDEYFDDARFFRVIPGFMAQFGIAGDPAKTKRWAGKSIQDDPVKKSNTRGMVTFAKRGPNTRTTQLFINFADRNSYLDPQGFAPFGRVIEGMEAVDAINGQYADAPLHDTMQIMQEGNAFLDGKYPGLDYIKTARIVE